MKTKNRRSSTAEKVALAAAVTALILAGGYFERGYIDWLGALALLSLGIPMLITWVKTENETRPGRRARR